MISICAALRVAGSADPARLRRRRRAARLQRRRRPHQPGSPLVRVAANLYIVMFNVCNVL